MAELIQVLDADVAPERRATSNARIASTWPSAVFAIPTHDPTTPPVPLRSRRARRTCRDGDVLGGSGDRPRSPPRPHRGNGGQPRAVGAGAFHPHPIDVPNSEPRTTTRGSPPASSRTIDTEHATVRVDRGRDVHIQMRIDPTRDRARALYDGHRHPFLSNGLRGGTHVPGRRP